MRWPWQAKPIPNEIDYAKCSACGGTGWAYGATTNECGEITRIHYIPCPACERGAEKLGDTETSLD